MPMVGNRKPLGDLGGEVERNAFEDDRERARVLDGGASSSRRSRPPGHAAALLSLHLVAAHAVHRLRREPDVPHHRDVDRA